MIFLKYFITYCITFITKHILKIFLPTPLPPSFIHPIYQNPFGFSFSHENIVLLYFSLCEFTDFTFLILTQFVTIEKNYALSELVRMTFQFFPTLFLKYQWEVDPDKLWCYYYINICLFKNVLNDFVCKIFAHNLYQIICFLIIFFQ